MSYPVVWPYEASPTGTFTILIGTEAIGGITCKCGFISQQLNGYKLREYTTNRDVAYIDACTSECAKRQFWKQYCVERLQGKL